MFLEKPQLVHQPPSALLGFLRPSGQPLALCSGESEAAPSGAQVLRAVSDAVAACRRVLAVGRSLCVVSCSVLLAAYNGAQRECGSPCAE